jgi:hypothetical protein
MLEEMLAEEAMMPAPEAEELPVESEDEMLAEMLGEDPMGVVEAEMGVEERLLMAKLFGKNAADEKAEAEDEAEGEEEAEEEKTAKKASFRPQPRKPANGVTRLGGGVAKEASASNDLSKLWDSAPDVSKYF